jgi:hypothetical protein
MRPSRMSRSAPGRTVAPASRVRRVPPRRRMGESGAGEKLSFRIMQFRSYNDGWLIYLPL